MVWDRWRVRATAADGGAASDRLAAVDAARGAALLAMAVFHARWDMAWLGLAGETRAVGPGWQAFGDAIAAAFLLLSGASLVFADRRGLGLPGKLRRLARLGAVALGITVATWIAVPGLAITCGMIHCVALGGLLALPLPRAPRWAAWLLAALLVALPFLPLPEPWDGPAAAWLGLGTRGLDTLDYRPLAPWAAFVPLGTLAARSLPARWLACGARWRALRWAGRHSLAVYLGHQAVLYPATALLALALGTTRPPPWAAAFDRQCQADCEASGAEAAPCRSTCACVRRGVADAGLEGGTRDAVADQARLSTLVRACFGRAGP